VAPQTRLFVAVGLGASLGSVARALTSIAMLHALGPGFPWGTLTVNVLGSFLIGVYATLTAPDGRIMVGPAMRQFFLSGFCGGFTTFSIFSLETLVLAEQGRFALAGLNAGGSMLLALAAVWAGNSIGERANRLKGALR
jgi:fluoride exporter